MYYVITYQVQDYQNKHDACQSFTLHLLYFTQMIRVRCEQSLRSMIIGIPPACTLFDKRVSVLQVSPSMCWCHCCDRKTPWTSA